MKKAKFVRRFQKRFLLRFHMSLILLATCLSGVLFSKLLLYLGVHGPLIRYPLVAALSYLLFFVFIKLWLWYVSTTTETKTRQTVDAVVENTVDLAPDPFRLFSGTSPSLESFAGGGGSFGGGGAFRRGGGCGLRFGQRRRGNRR